MMMEIREEPEMGLPPELSAEGRSLLSPHQPMMEEAPAVSCSLGSIGPLLARLQSLMHTEQSLPQELRKDEVQGFMEDLITISASVRDLSAAADSSFTDKCWMKEVREICYDMEDYLDMVLHSSSRDASVLKNIPWMKQQRRPLKIPWIQSKMTQQRRYLKVPWIRNKMKRQRCPLVAQGIPELRSRLQSTRGRRQQLRPAGLETMGVPAPVPVGPLLQTPHAVLQENVTELVSFLALGTEQQLKVVPVFGPAGIGKTTVATRLYQIYGGGFHCRAYLRVSRNPDTRRLLATLLSQIKGRQPLQGLCDLLDLTTSIRKHLQDKSYFVVVDDLWATSVWDIISRAFPEGNCCSRIIITTQIEDVALVCCSYHPNDIFKMKPLNDNQSQQFLFSRVFGSEQDCLDQEFKDVAYGAVRKSGGAPLAIISIASMLANWPNLVVEQKKYIQDGLCSSLRTNPTSEGMKEILYLIFNNLPAHLKTCLLYLNMYPEDYVIWKDDLVKQWVAEGFISALEGKDINEVAEDYFEELVARGMTQPVDTGCNDEVLSCTVNHMILDLIASECMDDNFITVIDYFETVTGLADKVRRLSVKLGGAKSGQIPRSFRMSQVRSIMFSGFFKCVPSIVGYKLMRVLILNIWTDKSKARLDLAIIRKLFQLRYLKIECNMAVKLPSKIRGLKHLLTLEIHARLATVPSDIVKLQCLSHLNLPSEVNLPPGMGQMKSLRNLGYFNLGTSSRHNVLDLGKLTNMQVLHLSCSPATSNRLVRNMESFASVLGKIRNLKSLVLDGGGSSSKMIACDGLSSVSPAPALLETLELSPRICTISRLPRWIQDLCKLHTLKISLQNLSSDDVDILKGLPALTALSLYVRTAPAERIVFNKEGFSVLKHFKFICTTPCVEFAEGAMLTVRRLKLGFSASTMKQYSLVDAGFKHLTGLEVFSGKIGGASAEESGRKAVRSELEKSFAEHPGPPIISVELVDWIFGSDRGITTMSRKGKHQTSEKDSAEVKHKGVLSRYIFGSDRGITTMSRKGKHQTSEKDSAEVKHKGVLSRINLPSQFSLHMEHPKSSSHTQEPGEDRKTRIRQEYCLTMEEHKDVIVSRYSGEKAESRSSLASESSLNAQNPDQEQDMNLERQQEEQETAEKEDDIVEEEPKVPYGFHEKEIRKYTMKQNDCRLNSSPEFVWDFDNPGDKKDGSTPVILMENAMVSASTGAVNSLIVKLTILMGEQYQKLTGNGNQESFIKDELQAMYSLLNRLPSMAELNMPMKNCVKRIREMTYALEDFIDDLMVQFVKEKDISSIIRSAIGYPEKKAILHKFINQFQKLKTQMAQEDICSIVSKTNICTSGPRYMEGELQYSTTYYKGSGLVGMDAPRDELVKLLIGGKQEKPQLVCILGVAGIGKTAIATLVYNMIKWQFDCRVFIHVSDKVCVTRLLQNILSQLRWDPELCYYQNNKKDMIDEIHKDLKDKRYIIVIDGANSAQIWEEMKHALPENNLGSRIIITTRISSVAKSCGKQSSSYIYHVKPLSFEKSLSSFQSVISGGSKRPCPIALEKVMKIVKSCGGVPLAINVTAGALASKHAEMEQWVKFWESMKQATTNPLNVEWMRKILYISYSNLPCDMKTCLLYFSAFPVHHVITKDHLIRRWVAEGFLPRRSNESWWQTGESYFLELIARKLIEPVYREDEHDLVPIGCQVHSSVHDFITFLSNEENFVKSDTADSSNMQNDVIRRLFLSLGSSYQVGNDNLESKSLKLDLDLFQRKRHVNPSKVRSFIIFSGDAKRMPDLSAFKHVRVLDLEDTNGLDNKRLEHIGRLSLLRYLGLGGTGIPGLPESVMALEHLATLDLTRTRVRELPESRCTKLVSLLANGLTIPRRIGEMQELEELSTVLCGHNGSLPNDVATVVNKLRRLRVLGVTFGHMYDATETDRQGVKCFLEEVGKSNLQSLLLHDYPRHLLDLLLDCWAHQMPPHLQKFELRIHGGLSEVQQEMASLIALTHLNIRVKVVEAAGVRALGNLPNLLLLDLITEDGTRGRCNVRKGDGFQRLKVFWFWCLGGAMGLRFEAGAMPQVRTLHLGMKARETKCQYGDFDFGIQHLSAIVHVHATINCRSARASDVMAVEDAMRYQISQIPKNPVLELIRVFKDKMIKDQGHNSQGEIWIAG